MSEQNTTTPSNNETPLKTEIELYKTLLKQIHNMYDNPELKRVCQEAIKGNWQSAFYAKYKPHSVKGVGN